MEHHPEGLEEAENVSHEMSVGHLRGNHAGGIRSEMRVS
jgi:hypothetical protein